MKNVCIKGWRVVTALLLALMLLAGCGKKMEVQEAENKLIIGYAEGVTAVENPATFSDALDKAYAESQEPGLTLEYKGVAYSTNGKDFSCYLANAKENQYDMFIAIYADDALTDELFLSELLRPGTAFDHITLNHALGLGQTNCTVAFTQIEEIDGEQTIHNQALIGVEFYVMR